MASLFNFSNTFYFQDKIFGNECASKYYDNRNHKY